MPTQPESAARVLPATSAEPDWRRLARWASGALIFVVLASLAPALDGRPGLVIAQGADDEFVSMPADAHVSFPRVYWNDDGGFRDFRMANERTLDLHRA